MTKAGSRVFEAPSFLCHHRKIGVITGDGPIVVQLLLAEVTVDAFEDAFPRAASRRSVHGLKMFF